MCLAASLTFIVFASLLAPLFALLAVVPFSPLLLFLLLPIVVPNWFTSSWFQFWIEEGREPKEWVVPSVFFCCTVGHYLPILTLFVCSCSLRFIHWSLVLLPWLLLLSIRTHTQSELLVRLVMPKLCHSWTKKRERTADCSQLGLPVSDYQTFPYTPFDSGRNEKKATISANKLSGAGFCCRHCCCCFLISFLSFVFSDTSFSLVRCRLLFSRISLLSFSLSVVITLSYLCSRMLIELKRVISLFLSSTWSNM